MSSPITLFSQGISSLASVSTSEDSTKSEKDLAEGLIKTLGALESQILTLTDKVNNLSSKEHENG